MLTANTAVPVNSHPMLFKDNNYSDTANSSLQSMLIEN